MTRLLDDVFGVTFAKFFENVENGSFTNLLLLFAVDLVEDTFLSLLFLLLFGGVCSGFG